MSTQSPDRLRSEALKVTVSICLCYTLCFFLVGVWLRVKSRSYKWDDTLAVAATVLSLGQFATQYIALAYGQGRSAESLSTSSDLSRLNQVSRAGVILFFLTLYISKGAAIALLYRFAAFGRHKLTVFISFGFIMLLGFVSVLLLNISCDLTGTLYWHISRKSTQCQNQYTRWQITTAFDFASEILVLFVPIDLIWSLQLKTKSKFIVLSRFWLRLPVLALAVGRFLYVRNLLFADDVGIASNKTVIMQEIEMAASLSTTVIITLRPFTKDFNTNFGQGGGTIAAYGISKAPHSGGGGTKSFSGSHYRGIGSKIATRLGLSSKIGSTVGSSVPRSGRNEKVDGKGMDLEDLRSGKYNKGQRKRVEKSESVKGLTSDGITQTIDFVVEYEDPSEESSSRVGERF